MDRFLQSDTTTKDSSTMDSVFFFLSGVLVAGSFILIAWFIWYKIQKRKNSN